MNNKSIKFTNEEFELVMRAIGMLSHIYGVMGDIVDEKYKNKSHKVDALENYLCEKADIFGLNNVVERFEARSVLNIEIGWYKDLIDDLDEFEEYFLYDNLTNKLAWRDFRNKFSKKEIEEMSKRNGGYFGVDIYDFEKKYYDEFDENGYDRLEVKD